MTQIFTYDDLMTFLNSIYNNKDIHGKSMANPS